jgi:hypothetical protein
MKAQLRKVVQPNPGEKTLKGIVEQYKTLRRFSWAVDQFYLLLEKVSRRTL